MISLLLIILGIAVLWAGGEILVRSVTGLAAVLRVSPTVIGLTVVAFGTSAPELAAAVAAALRDSPGLVYGNVVLLALMAYFLIVLVRAGDAEESDAQGVSGLKSVLGTLVGLALLAVGAAEILVPAAKDLALALGVSERVVGLTVVAFGTSVPELAACLVAAYRNHHGIVLGNIIGSNVFNILLVLPAATLIRPFETTFLAEGLDASVMLSFSLLMFLAVYLLRHGRSIGRTWGALLVAAYGGYVAWLFSKL